MLEEERSKVREMTDKSSGTPKILKNEKFKKNFRRGSGKFLKILSFPELLGVLPLTP